MQRLLHSWTSHIAPLNVISAAHMYAAAPLTQCRFTFEGYWATQGGWSYRPALRKSEGVMGSTTQRSITSAVLVRKKPFVLVLFRIPTPLPI